MILRATRRPGLVGLAVPVALVPVVLAQEAAADRAMTKQAPSGGISRWRGFFPAVLLQPWSRDWPSCQVNLRSTSING
jgi:hypothetical protein